MVIKKGFTLIELGISMGIMGSLALVGAQESRHESLQIKASALGNEIFQHNSAVSRYLAANAGDSSVVGTRTGSNWLKSSICSGGTATEDFLACDLMMDNRTVQYGSMPVTRISYSTEGELSARTVWDTIIGENGNPDSFIMGTAALVASGNYVSQYDDAASGYQSPTIFCPDLPTFSASISSICDSDRNAIISTANITSTVEPWLRTDHNNTMRHAIEFDPDGNLSTESELRATDNRTDRSWLRQIVGVARLYNNNGPGGQSLALGGRSGDGIYSDSFLSSNSLLNGAIIMDGDVGVMNDIYGKANAFIDGNIEAGNNISAGNNLSAVNNITAGNDIVVNRNVNVGNDVAVDRNVSAGNDVVANRYVSAGRDVNAGRDVRAQRDVRADRYNYSKRYYDSDNVGYYTDPASTSRMNSVNADFLRSGDEVHGTLFRDINNGGYYVDPASRSNVNSITAHGDIRAPIFYDQDYPSHFLNPSANSNIHSITAGGRIRANEFLHLNRTATIGTGCSPVGLVGRSSGAKGGIIECRQGKWQRPFEVKETPRVSASFTGNNTSDSYHRSSLGHHDFCALTGVQNMNREAGAQHCIVGKQTSGNWFVELRISEPGIGYQTWCSATCFNVE